VPIAARVFVVVAVVAGFAATLLLTWRNDTTLDHGETTTAQVISVQEGRRGTGTVTVRFTAPGGRAYTTTTLPGMLADPPPEVGSTIPVVYDPANPQATVRDPRAPRDTPIPPLLVAGAGVALLAAAVVAVVRRRTRS
jgi:hypothetical protein